MKAPDILRKDLIINDSHDYYCLVGPNQWRVTNSIPLKKALASTELDAMSLRLSTGIIGELDCAAGNRGPKGSNEVIIGVGSAGIMALLQLSGLPCTVCMSGTRLLSMNAEIRKQLTINTGTPSNAISASWLANNYDARRLDWDSILRHRIRPARFYTKRGITPFEIEKIKSMFSMHNVDLPEIGYYDKSSKRHFVVCQ